MVVDDNEQNIYLLKVLLESNGYDLITAQNGNEVLEKIKSQIPDLIISDILMPGMDGFSLCRNLKTDPEYKDIPFIFYTATYTDAKDEDFALSLGAERFIRKPAEPDKFLLIIRDILKQHKKGELADTEKKLEKEEVFYKKYNAALIRKMEDKMLELEMANKRLAALFHTSVDLSSLMPKTDLISQILTKMIEVIECSHANYFEYDEDKQFFSLQTVVGFPKRDVKKYQRELRFKLGEEFGLVGMVGKNREPLILEDTHGDPRWIKADKTIRSALFLPMVSEDHLIGVLTFLDTSVNKFDEKIARDMATLANNLAIAIEKTRYFEKIQQSELRYRTLIETSIDAIVSIDLDAVITDWNRGAEEMFAYPREELIGQSITMLMPKENQRVFPDLLKEVRKIGFKRKWETQMLTKDKRLLDIEMTFTYLGDKIGYMTILRDVTKQKKDEATLRENEDFLNSIIENIPNILSVREADDLRFIRFNKAGENILGYSREELYGKTNYDLLYSKAADKSKKNDQAALASKDLTDLPKQKVLTKNQEEKILHIKKIPILGEDGNPKYLLKIGEDITNLNRSEQLLNALNQATFAMATALRPRDIFTSVAQELLRLNLKCMLFQLDESKNSYFSTFIRCESEDLDKSNGKKPTVKFESFQLPISAVDIFKEIIHKKKTIFSEKTDEITKQVLPKFKQAVPGDFSKFMQIQKIILAPLVAEEKVIGMFTVQSNDLTQEDAPAITAFANQLAAAWNKGKLTVKLQRTMEGTIQTIASIVEKRDPYTAGHQNRVSDLAAAIAREMDLSQEQIEGVRIAGIIHDVGKIHVPAEILTKPGKLTEIEYSLVRAHPAVGYELLKNIDFPWPLAEIVHQHHEKIDGSGYPRGLKKDEILIEARILTVADVVEAMSSHRPYRPAMDIKYAKEEIKKNKGVLYDSDVVDACLKVLERGYDLSNNEESE
jgi:PAS domain S-box-containing protein/putative nucleotidyltransferase with HDIG domain